jgi:hypothetical protein
MVNAKYRSPQDLKRELKRRMDEQSGKVVKSIGKRGRKPSGSVPRPPARKPGVQVRQVDATTKQLTGVRKAFPGAVVTLTIKGTAAAIQEALDRLQS